VHVVALDTSRAMIALARRRIEAEGLEHQVVLEGIPTEELGHLGDEAAFDGLLSNFSGLNCVEDLNKVGRQLARLLKPRAMAIVCVFGRLCAWEMAWYLGRGNLRKSFRRLRRAVKSRVGHGAPIIIYYHSLRSLRRAFDPYFTLDRWLGIGVAVPPSYMEGFARRFPTSLAAAVRADHALARVPVWRNLADHQLLIFRRREP